MLWLKAFIFLGAVAGAGVRAGEKILGAGAGQKWTGSLTLTLAYPTNSGRNKDTVYPRALFHMDPDPAFYFCSCRSSLGLSNSGFFVFLFASFEVYSR